MYPGRASCVFCSQGRSGGVVISGSYNCLRCLENARKMRRKQRKPLKPTILVIAFRGCPFAVYLVSLTEIVPLDVCEWRIKSSGPVGSVLTTVRLSSFNTVIIRVHRDDPEVI